MCGYQTWKFTLNESSFFSLTTKSENLSAFHLWLFLFLIYLVLIAYLSYKINFQSILVIYKYTLKLYFISWKLHIHMVIQHLGKTAVITSSTISSSPVATAYNSSGWLLCYLTGYIKIIVVMLLLGYSSFPLTFTLWLELLRGLPVKPVTDLPVFAFRQHNFFLVMKINHHN